VIAFAPWQALLDGLGWVLAQIYDLVPNYGVSIILLTVVIRLILLPLGIKQIRSMQHMQIVQPRVKQIQQKYKGNKQRQQEEIMKLYREYGVNPFSGCWPVLLQFPILIAMYSVLRWPQHPIHVPLESELCRAVSEQIPQQIPVCDPNGEPITSQAQIDELGLPGPPGGTTFLATNLLCQAGLPWQEAPSTLPDRVAGADGGEAVEIVYPVECASTPLERVPYYVFAVLMFATTFYQQRQMQKASPPGAANPQQQALLKVMPILFGVFGIFFPAGLVLYWTTSNLWQIGQQHFMLKTRPTEETLAANARSKPQKGEKKGFMSSMMDRAEQERKRRETGGTRNPDGRKPGGPKSGNPKPGTKRPGSGPRKPGGGGNGGGDPKKRPKR
jgi:YidC/Oxa1 family membrane protein insertase